MVTAGWSAALSRVTKPSTTTDLTRVIDAPPAHGIIYNSRTGNGCDTVRGLIMISPGGRRFLHLLPLVICCVISAQVPANLKNMDLEAVDTSCKPCDDFYRFAIGKWNERNPIPADQAGWSKRWAGADVDFG